MKKSLILSAIASAALISSARADVIVDISGSTAFRTAAHQAILKGYTNNANRSWGWVGSATAFNGASQAIFRGNFGSVTGITTIRTSWSGSIEGLGAITQNTSVPFISAVDLTTSNSTGRSGQTASVTGIPQMAFSDVDAANTPNSINKGLIAGEATGILVFAPMVNKGAPAEFDNITSKQFASLASKGTRNIGFFTGNDSVDPVVYFTGRNDSSGTRGIYLSETATQSDLRTSISSAVAQYRVQPIANSTVTAATSLQLWPFNDGNTSGLENRSVQWGLSQDGNSGYAGSGDVRAVMTMTSNSVNLLGPGLGNTTTTATNQNVLYVTSLSGSDAYVSRNQFPFGTTNVGAGGRILKWNGVGIDHYTTTNSTVSAGQLTDASYAKVVNGAYTLWSYENLYKRTSAMTSDRNLVYAKIVSDLSTEPTVKAIGFVNLNDMFVGRTYDGSVVD